MAPKTRSSAAGKVVVTTTTKKIVEETVQHVVVSPSDEKEIGGTQGLPDTIVSHESSVKENNEVIPSSLSKQLVKKVVVVEDKTIEDEEEVIGTVSSPSSSSAAKRRRLLKKDIVVQDKTAEEENYNPEVTKHEEQEEEEENRKKRKGKSGKGDNKRRRRKKKKDYVEYKRYVYMVMKQVHPDMGISSKAMTVINNLISDMFERIAEEASKLSKYVGKATMSFLEIQDAVKLVLPGDLGKHAIAEGSKALNKYSATVSNARANSKYRTNSNQKKKTLINGASLSWTKID